jgi:hypothetical protein
MHSFKKVLKEALSSTCSTTGGNDTLHCHFNIDALFLFVINLKPKVSLSTDCFISGKQPKKIMHGFRIH